MNKKRRQSHYCRFCGSTDTTNVVITNTITDSKVLAPSINVAADLGTSMKLEIGSYGITKSSKTHYPDTYCKLCRNINVNDNNTPKKITTNKDDLFVVIPFVLDQQLEINHYKSDDIIDLIRSITKTLEKIYHEWFKSGGGNICKNGKVGKTIKIKLHSKLKISCNVIVDTLYKKVIFRLCYGGRKVNCN